MTGTIIKNISNDYTVNCNGKHYICKPRGKFRLNNLTPLVGDIVEIDDLNNYIIDIIIDNPASSKEKEIFFKLFVHAA